MNPKKRLIFSIFEVSTAAKSPWPIYFLIILLEICFSVYHSEAIPLPLDSIISNPKDTSHLPIFFSLNAGYHSSSGEKPFHDFPSGAVFGAKIDVPLSKFFYIGFTLNYWRASDISSNPIEMVNHERNYSSLGFGLFGEIMFNIRKLQLTAGAGAGNYEIDIRYVNGGTDDKYFNLFLFVGIDIPIWKMISLKGEASYYSLGNFNRSAQTFNLKIGPAIRF